jgi:hypothetical protein
MARHSIRLHHILAAVAVQVASVQNVVAQAIGTGGASGATGGTSGITGVPAVLPGSRGFILFFFGGVLLTTGLLVLHQSQLTLRWILRGDAEHLDPEALVFPAQLIAVLGVVAWGGCSIVRARMAGLDIDLVALMFFYPADVAIGLLLASLIPALTAVIKLSPVLMASSEAIPIGSGFARPAMVSLLVVMIAALNALASVVTIYVFFWKVQ